MTALALLHRWAGGLVGVLLAILGLSGTVLLWEGSWIMLDGADEAPASSPAQLGHAIEVAMGLSPDLSRITFAGEEIGLHQAVYADGGGAYIAQDGVVVERWTGMWERPELWLFDLHHYLLAGEAGKLVVGMLGLLLMAFVVTGTILWWRTRRTFRFQLWPPRYTASAIIRHHRDLGVVASPLLILAAATGTFMIFPSLASTMLAPLAEGRATPVIPSDLAPLSRDVDWERAMAQAQQAFPHAAARRLMIPTRPGEPIAIRLRQDFEWTPNGRSYVWIDPETADIVGSDDPAGRDAASSIVEKFYPIHAAKVGGLWWRIIMTFGGLALAMLGGLASWSFWSARVGAQSPGYSRLRSARA